MAKITKISEIKPENNLFVFDKEYNDKRPTLYQVSDFIDAYKERPEDFGKAVMAVHAWPKLDKDWIKEAINDYLNDHAIESEEFYGGEDFTIDDLWDDETLRLSKIVEILENMLFRSGYFLKPCDALEIDYSELATAKPEPEPASEPTPNRREILEAKKEKYLRILIAELHSMEETLQHPFTVGAAVCAKSNVYQAAYDLGEVVFALAQLEKEEKNQCGTT